MKVKGILVFILMASLVVFSVGPAAGQSVYLSADHHTQQFDAWNINSDGTIVYQATYNLSYATDPAGIAIDAVTGVGNDPLMFVTTEGIGGIEVINPVTLQFHGVAPGPINMGGVDVDDIDNIIFAIQRGTSEYGGNGTSELYIYSYNDDGSGITQQAHITLPNHGAGFSLAFDDLRDILWVSDYADHMVRAYDVNVPTWPDIVEIPTLSFSVSHGPIDVAVDSRRNLVYTVAGWAGSPLLTKYDVDAGVETAIDLGEGGIGITVEEIRGYVYITRGPELYSEYPDGDDIQVWDCSTSPFTLLQDTDPIGNPAGIAIGPGYDSLNLAKNDAVVGYGVYIGQTFTYEITFDNYRNPSHDITGVTIVDDLPAELDFVSETVGGIPGTGTYDSPTHTVTWDIGTIPAGQAGPFIELVVRVNQNATPDTTIYNWVTIDSDQLPPHTEPGYDPDNPEPDDPGTPVLPNILVDIDIKPQSCPNPFNTKAKGVLPVAVLGTEDFDATTVDPATVLLEGVAPLRWNFEDVSTPVESGADTCECTTEGPDGYMDMTLKFDHREILAALGTVQDGEMRVLTLTGMTYDSIPIMGQDCVVIIHKGAAKLSAETPTEFSLSSNYPNPFNPETNISFTLPERTQVTLIIYNILGERVKTLVNRDMEAGIHTIHWDGADGSGNSIASGIYFYKLSAGDFTATKKMVLTK